MIRRSGPRSPIRWPALGVTVEILVNNAACRTWDRFARVSVSDELRLIELDVAAVVDLSARFVPAMVARGRGAVLNVASSGAFGPVPFQASYGRPRRSCSPTPRLYVRNCGTAACRGRGSAPGRLYAPSSAPTAGIPDEEAEKMLPPFLWEQADAWRAPRSTASTRGAA